MGGFTDIFATKVKPDADIHHIKTTLSRQQAWLEKLHNYSAQLSEYATAINNSNVSHKKEILGHIHNINQWIDYFNTSHNDLKKEMLSLKKDLRETLKQDFKAYHEIMSDMMELKIKQEQLRKDQLKKEVYEEVKAELNQIFSNQEPIYNEETPDNVNNVMHYTPEIELSNSEKKILSLLFNENQPMTYELLAKRMDKSINTVRVYMNSLKSKKDIIEEFKAPSGAKIFSIKNSELVKTLFNIE